MQFEGEEVDGFSISLKQHKGPIAAPLIVGEIVEVTVRGRVVAVNHRENRRNGRFYRDHEVVIDEIVGS